MKTAKVPPAEPSASSRRSQPVRQTRTNPPRANNSGLSRLAGRNSLSGATAAEQSIEIYPGVTHFADAITALPKELVRHFTLLKEVDAKIFAPEEALFQLVDAVFENPPPPEVARSLTNDAASNGVPISAPMSAQNSSSGTVINGHVPPQPAPAAAPAAAAAATNGFNESRVFDPCNYPRRHLFRQTAVKITDLLVALEEKNHVISTANDALQKQLARIDDIWPHLEAEFSEEAKWGSDTHWAYPENRAARALNNQAERTRREGAANLSAAALVIAEEAAARSDARKQAVAAKKSQKNQHQPQHQDSEHDDHDAKGKEVTGKKTNTKRKTAAASTATESPASVGLGITGQASTSSTPAPKRRKLEKPTNGGTPTERATNTVVTNAKDTKTKPSASPRATPAPDQPAPKKQRKALPNSNGQAKKRAGPGASPSVASSPVVATFPDSAKAPRASPAPSVSGRPASARARQSSIASNADNTRPRPPSAASTKPNGGVPAPLEIPPSNGARAPNDTPKITQMEPPSATAKTDPSKQQNERVPTPSSATPAGQKKEGSVKPADEGEARKEPTPSAVSTPTTQQIITTKSGRASKPSTPAIGSFPDGPPSNNGRTRPSRNSEAPTVPKRSHKKGASAAHAAAVQKALAQQQKADEDTSSMQDEDMDVDDPNEPRYCYCNRISFGEMVGCDGDKCKIEWFHLECVGLRSAPPPKIKWYCDECKKHVPNNGKKVNGR